MLSFCKQPFSGIHLYRISRCFSLLILFGVLVLDSACTYTSVKPSSAYFYWKTIFQLSEQERTYLKALGCEKLYVKFLDVARDPDVGRIRPYSLLTVADTAGLTGKTIVPAIFLTNSVFTGISETEQKDLVKNVLRAVRSVGKQFSDTIFQEILIDCDWTASSREAFFYFLKNLERQLSVGTQLIATIRLHQYKLPGQTGVPPVARGMLMCYNTGDIDHPDEKNSIFEPEDAARFLSGTIRRYPLPLDLALPVFSWSLAYRDEELFCILPALQLNELADTSRFWRLDSIRFQVRRRTFAEGHYLRPGDMIRFEQSDPGVAAAAAKNLPDWRGTFHIAFFDLAPTRPQDCPVALLDSICQYFLLPEAP